MLCGAQFGKMAARHFSIVCVRTVRTDTVEKYLTAILPNWAARGMELRGS